MSKQQNMRTPQWFFDQLEEHILPPGWFFKLDAFADDYNALCDTYCTDTGLSRDWVSPTFANPPFNMMGKAIAQASEQRKKFGITSVVIGPPPCSQNWAHKYIFKRPGVHVFFPDNRIQFLNPDGTPTSNNRVDIAVYRFGTGKLFRMGVLPFKIPKAIDQVKLVLAGAEC